MDAAAEPLLGRSSSGLRGGRQQSRLQGAPGDDDARWRARRRTLVERRLRDRDQRRAARLSVSRAHTMTLSRGQAGVAMDYFAMDGGSPVGITMVTSFH